MFAGPAAYFPSLLCPGEKLMSKIDEWTDSAAHMEMTKKEMKKNA